MSTNLSRFSLAALFVVITGCQSNPARNAPVQTQTPSGSSTAPSAVAAERRDNALVRVVHAISSGPSVDVFADDNRLFDALEFRSVTPYREMDDDEYTFRARIAGASDDRPLATREEELEDGRFYTVIAIPGVRTAADLRVVVDEVAVVPADKARVRFVHAAVDAGAIDIRDAGRDTDVFEDVAFQAVTPYREVDPVSGMLEVRPAGADTPSTRLPEVRLAAGTSYTVVVVGRGSSHEAFVIQDSAATRR